MRLWVSTHSRMFAASRNGSPDPMAVYGGMFEVVYFWPPTGQGQRRREPRALLLATSGVKIHRIQNRPWYQANGSSSRLVLVPGGVVVDSAASCSARVTACKQTVTFLWPCVSLFNSFYSGGFTQVFRGTRRVLFLSSQIVASVTSAKTSTVEYCEARVASGWMV